MIGTKFSRPVGLSSRPKPAGLDGPGFLVPTTEVVGYYHKSLRDKDIPAVRPVRDAVIPMPRDWVSIDRRTTSPDVSR